MGNDFSFPLPVTYQNLYVSRLPADMDDAGLMALFAPLGGVARTKVMIDTYTKISKRFGFVLFQSDACGRAAHNYIVRLKHEHYQQQQQHLQQQYLHQYHHQQQKQSQSQSQYMYPYGPACSAFSSFYPPAAATATTFSNLMSSPPQPPQQQQQQLQLQPSLLLSLDIFPSRHSAACVFESYTQQPPPSASSVPPPPPPPPPFTYTTTTTTVTTATTTASKGTVNNAYADALPMGVPPVYAAAAVLPLAAVTAPTTLEQFTMPPPQYTTTATTTVATATPTPTPTAPQTVWGHNAAAETNPDYYYHCSSLNHNTIVPAEKTTTRRRRKSDDDTPEESISMMNENDDIPSSTDSSCATMPASACAAMPLCCRPLPPATVLIRTRHSKVATKTAVANNKTAANNKPLCAAIHITTIISNAINTPTFSKGEDPYGRPVAVAGMDQKPQGNNTSIRWSGSTSTDDLDDEQRSVAASTASPATPRPASPLVSSVSSSWLSVSPTVFSLRSWPH